MLPAPAKLPTHDAYAPLLALLSDVLIDAAALSEHWGYDANHLANLRRGEGKGIPFIKLPTGGIRYRMSDVLAAEIGGTSGPITLERVALAIAACTSVPAEHRTAIVAHVQAALRPPRKG